MANCMSCIRPKSLLLSPFLPSPAAVYRPFIPAGKACISSLPVGLRYKDFRYDGSIRDALRVLAFFKAWSALRFISLNWLTVASNFLYSCWGRLSSTHFLNNAACSLF